MKSEKCRCGWSGEPVHPCHGDAYTCRRPAKSRFYNAQLVALAGMQMKAQVTQTFACDACFEKFMNDIAEHRAKMETAHANRT